MVFPFARHIDIPTNCDFSILEADLGVSISILPASKTSIRVLGEQQKHIDAIDVQFIGSKIKIERLKTGLINDWFFWQNNWKNVAQVAIFIPTIRSIEAQNRATVRLVDMQFENPQLIAKFGGLIQLVNCVTLNPIEKSEFGGQIEHLNHEELGD